MATFLPCDDDQLLEFVSNYPVLYDAGSAGYKDIIMRDNIWKMIGEKMNRQGEECKKRWKSLRDSFFRIEKKNKKPTGSAAGKKIWHLQERLSFLNQVRYERDSMSNIESQGTEEENSTPTETRPTHQIEDESSHNNIPTTIPISSSVPTTVLTPKPALKRAKRDDNSDIMKLFKQREEQRKADRVLLEKLTMPKSSHLDSFTDHIKSVLESLPRPMMIQAKTEIFYILSKYELEAASSSSNSASLLTVIVSEINSTDPHFSHLDTLEPLNLNISENDAATIDINSLQFN